MQFYLRPRMSHGLDGSTIHMFGVVVKRVFKKTFTSCFLPSWLKLLSARPGAQHSARLGAQHSARLGAQHALVRRLAPAAPDAPGTGDVSAQHAAAFPAPGPVIRSRSGTRGAAVRILVPTSAGMRFIRACVFPIGDSAVRPGTALPVRPGIALAVRPCAILSFRLEIDGRVRPVCFARCYDRALPVPAGSAHRAVPVGLLAGHAEHEPATAFEIVDV